MNNNRRKRIHNIINDLYSNNTIDEIINELDFILMEEEDAFYNTPENLQVSWRGQESEEAIDLLNEAIDLLNEIHNNVEVNFIDNIDDDEEVHDLSEVIALLEQVI